MSTPVTGNGLAAILKPSTQSGHGGGLAQQPLSDGTLPDFARTLAALHTPKAATPPQPEEDVQTPAGESSHSGEDKAELSNSDRESKHTTRTDGTSDIIRTSGNGSEESFDALPTQPTQGSDTSGRPPVRADVDAAHPLHDGPIVSVGTPPRSDADPVNAQVFQTTAEVSNTPQADSDLFQSLANGREMTALDAPNTVPVRPELAANSIKAQQDHSQPFANAVGERPAPPQPSSERYAGIDTDQPVANDASKRAYNSSATGWTIEQQSGLRSGSVALNTATPSTTAGGTEDAVQHIDRTTPNSLAQNIQRPVAGVVHSDESGSANKAQQRSNTPDVTTLTRETASGRAVRDAALVETASLPPARPSQAVDQSGPHLGGARQVPASEVENPARQGSDPRGGIEQVQTGKQLPSPSPTQVSDMPVTTQARPNALTASAPPPLSSGSDQAGRRVSADSIAPLPSGNRSNHTISLTSQHMFPPAQSGLTADPVSIAETHPSAQSRGAADQQSTSQPADLTKLAQTSPAAVRPMNILVKPAAAASPAQSVQPSVPDMEAALGLQRTDTTSVSNAPANGFAQSASRDLTSKAPAPKTIESQDLTVRQPGPDAKPQDGTWLRQVGDQINQSQKSAVIAPTASHDMQRQVTQPAPLQPAAQQHSPVDAVVLESKMTEHRSSPVIGTQTVAEPRGNRASQTTAPLPTAPTNAQSPAPTLVSTMPAIAHSAPPVLPAVERGGMQRGIDTTETPPRFASDRTSFAHPDKATAPVTQTLRVPPNPAAAGQAIPVLPNDQPARAEAALSFLTPSEDSDMLHWDPTRAAQVQPGNLQPLRADLAPQIARQMVEVMPQAAHRPTEIALSPQELGRVRMSVTTEDGSVTVNILAERPETLDLMRRHIDQLGQTFRSMGYDSITFSFGQGEGSGDQSAHDQDGNAPRSATTSMNDSDQAMPLSETADPVSSIPTTGIDIRL